MALWSVAGRASSAGMTDSRKRSTSCRFCSRYCLMSIRRRRLASPGKGVNATRVPHPTLSPLERGKGEDSWNRGEVQIERDFPAGPWEDEELGLREWIEVAIREGRDHLGAIGRGLRPGGRAIGRVVRTDSHRHDLPDALHEHHESVLREVAAVAVERDGYLKVLVVQYPPD